LSSHRGRRGRGAPPRRMGVRRERELVREAWSSGLYAVRSPASGAGTAMPRPDLIIFGRGGVVDVVQIKTTRRRRVRYTPEDWRDELEVADRLRRLGFKVRVLLDFTLILGGGLQSIHKRFVVDGHENCALNISYNGKRKEITHYWVEK